MALTESQRHEIETKARAYVAAERHPVFRDEVEAALTAGDWDDLFDRFYTQLAFGTAGMRGVIGGGTNRINPFMVRKVSQGLAEYLVANSADPSVTIAYDSRHYSAEFAKQAALVLCANGVHVRLFDTLHPVPMLSFALRYLHATAGIVVTASHNPSKYNGYKVYWSDGGQVTPPHDVGIAALANAVEGDGIKDISEEKARKSGLLDTVPPEVDEAYYAMVLGSLRRPGLVKGSPITVAYTPLHGSGNVPVRHMLEQVGIRCCVVAEQEQPDGAFPTVKLPNPESAEAMRKVIALAKEVKADIVLGTDPDADRLGIAIPASPEKTDYLLLTGNQIAALLCDYLLATWKELAQDKDDIPACYGKGAGRKTPLCVKSLVTTDLVKRIAEADGAVCKDVLTGFKYIAEQIASLEGPAGDERFFLFGCEESYGYLTVPAVRDKDAVSSAMCAVEMMCWYASRGVTLQQRLNQIYDTYGYSTEVVFSRDYEGAAGKARMDAIMANFRTKRAGDVLVNLTVESVQDLKGGDCGDFPSADVIIIRFTSGEKLVVRPSGTEPKIKYYLFLTAAGDGGRTALEASLDDIVSRFKAAF